MFGASLIPLLRASGHGVVCQGRGQNADMRLDPADTHSVENALRATRAEVAINLVGSTNVHKCEADPAYAYHVNAATVYALSTAIKRSVGTKTHLIHISTDQVYSGTGPHEESEVQPINVYGLSKYAGETAALNIGATVLRTNFFGKSQCPGRKSLSDWVVDNLRSHAHITVFSDVRFSALNMRSLGRIIDGVIAERPAGVLNVGCRDGISKAEFAISLGQALGLSVDSLRVGVSAEAGLQVRRPNDMTLCVKRIEGALGITCPTFAEEIEKTAKEYCHV